MIDHRRIPEPTREALVRYIENKIPTGGFLEAVLTNDLRESIGRADAVNVRAIPEIVSWLYNEAPSACWGSREKVKKWLGRDD